jgi:hypothetical protein
MSTTHIGKIGRLPKNIRHFLGQRIEDGIPNKELVAWLNETQAVKDVLALRFGGRAITEQNLSEWKQTGHVEWVRREERRALALQLTEQREEVAMEPEESVAEKEISDRLGRELGMEMARLALELVNMEGSIEERWNRLCGVYRELSQVRRDDHRAERTRIQRERWKHELELEEATAEAQELERQKQRVVTRLKLPMMVPWMAEAFGGGSQGLRLAELVLRLQTDEPLEEVGEWYQQAQKKRARGSRPECARAGKAKANDEGTGVRPPMTNGAEEEAPSTNLQPPEKHQEPKADGESMEMSHAGPEAGAPTTPEIRVNPSKSNQNFLTTKEPRNEGRNE